MSEFKTIEGKLSFQEALRDLVHIANTIKGSDESALSEGDETHLLFLQQRLKGVYALLSLIEQYNNIPNKISSLELANRKLTAGLKVARDGWVGLYVSDYEAHSRSAESITAEVDEQIQSAMSETE